MSPLIERANGLLGGGRLPRSHCHEDDTGDCQHAVAERGSRRNAASGSLKRAVDRSQSQPARPGLPNEPQTRFVRGEIDASAIRCLDGCESLLSQGGTLVDEEATMSRRVRKWVTAIMTAATTAVLVWLPTAAQAGIAASGID
jgi:hypothetical protein